LDTFAVQGTQQQLHELYGYDKKGIIRLVKQLAVHSPSQEKASATYTMLTTP